MNAPAKITGVPIDPDLLAKAEANGIDVAQACEKALYIALRRARDPRSSEERRAADERWVAGNRAAMEGWNRWVDEHGLPGAAYRIF